MKILLVVHQFFPTQRAGTEVLTLEVARGLRRNGHDVEILTGEAVPKEPASTPPWLSEDEYDGVRVHRLHYGDARASDAIALDSLAPARIELVGRLISRVTPEIVHLHHMLGLSSGVIPAIRRLRTPVVYTATDFWAICPLYTLLRSFDGRTCEGPGDGVDCIRCCVKRFAHQPAFVARMAKWAVRTRIGNSSWSLRQASTVVRRAQAVAAHVNAANMIISGTKFLAETLVRNGIDARLMRVIPYGIDVGTVSPKPTVPAKFSPGEPLRLVFMGTMASHKGVHVLLDAVIGLEERGREISLHLYGAEHRGDAYYEGIRGKVTRLAGIALLKGTFDHHRIGEVMSAYHLLVVPSLWYESTPLVLCSALACGVPALVSRLAGMTEIIEEGRNGLSFPAGDASALRAMLLRLLDEPDLVAGLQGSAAARPRHTADYTADLEAAYAEVMSRA